MATQLADTVTSPLLLSVLQTSTHARNQALSLLSDVDSRTSSTGPTTADYLAISTQQKELIHQLAKLRGSHRDAVQGARDTKAETSAARQEVDKLHLQLQNLYYEQRHLRGAIEAAEGYDHQYLQLPLIPLPEFLALHPDLGPLEESDPNALMVARIEYEHKEREELEGKRQGLLKKKQGLIQENKRRKEELGRLDGMLEGFIDAARPIQRVLEKEVQSAASAK